MTCLVDESYYFIKRQIDINLFSFAQLTDGRSVISVSAERILKHKTLYWLVNYIFGGFDLGSFKIFPEHELKEN